MKKIIGIEIDEIIRAKFQQFDKYYAEEFGEELADKGKFTLDYWNDFNWEDTDETINYLNEELPDDISPLEYQVDSETGEAPVDHMAFRKRIESRTAKENFNKFLYQDYMLEIFGNAQKIYRNVDVDIESFYTKYKDFADIRIISTNENWFTIQATLFFLSKVRPRFKHYHFLDDNEVWDIADIMITTNPKTILNKPKKLLSDKVAIMLKRPYNYDIENDVISDKKVKKNVKISTMNIVDLIDNKEFEKLIGYEKPKKDNKD